MAKLFTASSIILLICLVLVVVSAGPTTKKKEDLKTDKHDAESDDDDEHHTTTSKPLTTTKKIAATTKKSNEVKRNDNKKDAKKPAEIKKTDPKKGDADKALDSKKGGDGKKAEAKSKDNNKQKPDAKKTPDAKSAANAKPTASTKPTKSPAKPATNKPGNKIATEKSASNKPTTKKQSTNAKPNVPQDSLEQILKPLLKMVIIQDKNQSKAGSLKLELKKELSCLSENQRKSMQDVIKKCSENSTKTKETNNQKVDQDFEESHPVDKHHAQHVKTMKHSVCVEKCFIRNMVANNGSNNSEIDTEKMKSLIQQVNLPDSQKQIVKTSLDQCMLNYTLNSTKLRGFLHRMAQDEDKMTDLLSKLVDQMLEKRNNETEIQELKELKEYIPLIKGMVCIVKSLNENGCKASAPNPVKLDAPKKGK